MDLGYAVDCQRALDCDIGARVPWGGGAKRSDCARTEQSQVVQFTHLNDVVKPCDIDLQFAMKIIVSQKKKSLEGTYDGDFGTTG